MKYFTDHEHKLSYSYEFYMGKWDGQTFNRIDSVYLSDNYFYLNKGLEDALFAVFPTFDSFGETEISFAEWIHIGELIPKNDIVSQEIYTEGCELLGDAFKKYGFVTILGI